MYLGIDVGTSSVKSVLMDADQRVLASATAELDVARVADGRAEQDPAQWLEGVADTLEAVRGKAKKAFGAVRGIGLSGHMHGATLIDASDEVVRPCMLWNDTRAQAEAARLDTPRSRTLTGNILFPGFTGPKVAWVAEHEPDAFARTARVLLPKDYVRLWLTGEHVSEMSDASGTGWLDVGARAWAPELVEATGLTMDQVPRLVEGTAVSGTLRSAIAERFGLDASVVVAGGGGDNAASACGMGTVAPGSAFLSLGTSGVLFAANERFLPEPESAVHAFCHALPGTWHQMGVILSATDSLNWLGRVTGRTPAELAELAATPDPDGSHDGDDHAPIGPTDTVFLPYLGGERTPHDDAAVRGALVGLAHGTGPAELARAVLQGVAFAFRDSRDALAAAGTTLERAYAIGGGARSDWWLSMIATALDLPLDVAADGDYGAGLGAARLALIAAEGADPVAVCTPPPVERSVEPVTRLTKAFDLAAARHREAYLQTAPMMRNAPGRVHGP